MEPSEAGLQGLSVALSVMSGPTAAAALRRAVLITDLRGPHESARSYDHAGRVGEGLEGDPTPNDTLRAGLLCR